MLVRSERLLHGIEGPIELVEPSAWLFLIRLHACRAGLCFARRTKYRLC